jgi:hypothetical protein
LLVTVLKAVQSVNGVASRINLLYVGSAPGYNIPAVLEMPEFRNVHVYAFDPRPTADHSRINQVQSLFRKDHLEKTARNYDCAIFDIRMDGDVEGKEERVLSDDDLMEDWNKTFLRRFQSAFSVIKRNWRSARLLSHATITNKWMTGNEYYALVVGQRCFLNVTAVRSHEYSDAVFRTSYVSDDVMMNYGTKKAWIAVDVQGIPADEVGFFSPGSYAMGLHVTLCYGVEFDAAVNWLRDYIGDLDVPLRLNFTDVETWTVQQDIAPYARILRLSELDENAMIEIHRSLISYLQPTSELAYVPHLTTGYFNGINGLEGESQPVDIQGIPRSVSVLEEVSTGEYRRISFVLPWT